MPKKPEVELVDPRLLSKGVVIWHKSGSREEVIRDISVVLHLANGESQSYKVGTDEVEVLSEQPSPVNAAKILLEQETPEEARDRLRDKLAKMGDDV